MVIYLLFQYKRLLVTGYSQLSNHEIMLEKYSKTIY